MELEALESPRSLWWGFASHVATGMIGAFGMALASYFGAIPAMQTAEVSQLQAAFSQINELRNRLDKQDKDCEDRDTKYRDLQKASIAQADTIARLRLKVDQTLDVEDVLREMVEQHPGPGWAKRVEKGADGRPQFRMAFINSEYALRYGIAKAAYEGRLDTEVQGEKVGRGFYVLDLRVYRTKRPHSSKESWEVKGKRVSGAVWKFFFRYRDQEFIVGFVLEDTVADSP